ncbi:hypothetical protein WR25_21961 [Diploscapter pachys]|uniref:TLC domain-containing protein n=1 Tax=Diploscapter pachys TaxID=2018661 RepID=A0A2A2KMW0_9BILA|nr:hypothetical protein WR25_21961 [Diploscapter pachys]
MSINVEPNEETVTKIASALEQGWQIYQSIKNEKSKGYVTYKEDTRSDGNVIEVYQEYMPYLFAQYKNEKYKEFDSFSTAVDEFYSKLENQKHQQKALNIEKEAIRKVENVKKDQETRIQALVESEERQKLVAERIIMNEEFVERASLVIRNAIANKLTWDAIEEMRRKAAEAGDEVAKSIVKLQLDRNQFVMRLSDPYDDEEPPVDATIDLSLNAYQNSRNFFIDKKAAGEKARKTAGSAGIAIKNAQIKAKETLDKVRIKTDVAKTRKTMWFEKFLWFISSENYIVVAGRDAQQNEMLVKRYLRPGDIYVHADLRGASSVVVRNKPGGEEIPPKTLTEAAQMAVCYSNAWEAGVVASAWWVRHDQVSRTAPTGEYLASGSFMIRGKKNFMPASQLVMGFGIMFRVDEESAERHKGERKVIDSNTAAPSEIGDESAPNEEEELNLDEEDQENDGNQENEEKEEDEFPDVQVNVQTLRIARSTDEEEYSIIEIGPKNQPGNKKRSQTKAEEKALETKKYLEQKEAEERKAAASAKIAKYQKRKQQKIKKKYGDADEEETALRLQILGSRGKQDPKESEVEKKKVEEKSQNSEKPGNSEKPEQEHPERLQKKEAKKRDSDDENEKDEEEHANLEDSDAFLDQLTGKPTDEDNILYSVPMVGPYQTFSNFKYKVKLTKGTGKRGKAAKSALELFLRLKIANPREEAHIRALIGEDSVARNVPGKIFHHLTGGFASNSKQKRMLAGFARLSFYTASTIYGIIVLWDKSWLWNVEDCWIDYPFHHVPDPIWWYYMLECGFYYSLLIASIWDGNKSDFWELTIHHCVTIGLLSASWTVNCVRVGTLVLLSHDTADVFLEFCKFVRLDFNNDFVTNSSTVTFLVVWLITRLVYYPLVVIRSSIYDAPSIIFPEYQMLNFTQVGFLKKL